MRRLSVALLLLVIYAFGGNLSPQALIVATNGGMAPYATAIQNSTSSSSTLTAVTNFNSYISGRCGWSLTSTNVSRLASADWSARSAGPPRITAQQLATAATALINNKLSTMTAAQQKALVINNASVHTPKGTLGLNPRVTYASVVQNSDGTFTVTISPDAFAGRKLDFQSLASSMVSSGTNFYPAEGIVVTYSVASGDMGFGNDYVTAMRTRLGNLTGLNLSNSALYGDQGYMIRRPLQTFLTDAAVNQFFAALGF
jgi:hypothetical protein